jgi:hypothetical protein
LPKTNFVFDYSNSELAKKLASVDEKMKAALLMYSATKAAEYEAYMKMNRPWTDRTGKAKATLNAKVSQPQSKILRITLAHGVDYGIWLELAHESRFAIIKPTVNLKGPDYIDGLSKLFSKVNV